MTRCPVDRCAGTANPGWTICRACGDELQQTLLEVPDLTGQLRLTLARQSSGPRSGARSSEQPLPYDARAAEASWILRNTLVGWVRDLEENPRRHPVDDPDAMAVWLLRRFGALLVHRAAQEVVSEITSAARQGWAVVDRPPDRVFLGRCPGCSGSAMYAPRGALSAICPDCETEHDVATLRAALTVALDDKLVTAAEFAGMLVTLGVPINRHRTRTLVNVWAARGRIATHAGPTYRFGELQRRVSEHLDRSRPRHS